jgi:hypothetical protein
MRQRRIDQVLLDVLHPTLPPDRKGEDQADHEEDPDA